MSSAVEPLSGSVAFADFSRPPLPLIERSDDIEPPLAERFFIDLSELFIVLSAFIGRSVLMLPAAPVELCPDIVPDELIEPCELGIVPRAVVPGALWPDIVPDELIEP